MSSINSKIRKLLHPLEMVTPLGCRRFLDWMPDSIYCSLVFRAEMGYKLDLKNPLTFNEKLQWLKVNDHRPEYTEYVDKLRAKQIVGQLIGFQHIVPVLGKWEKAEQIQFQDLPDKFVLKCNHDQGSVKLVSDKNELDIQETIKIFSRKLKNNQYYGTREYPYKDIKPYVFAEEFLGSNIIDYKFYCFSGEPKFLYCGQGLTEDHSLKIDFFDLDWNLMPFYRTDYHRLGQIPRPEHLDEMIEIAKKLSVGVPFVRIDLFEVDGKVFFSEYTLYPASGFMPFVPEKYDRIIGDMMDISGIEGK